MLPNLPYNIVNSVPMTVWNGVGGSKLHLVHTLAEWKALHELLMRQSLVACDTETSGFRWYREDELCGMSFGWNDMHFYVAARHKPSIQGGDPPEQLDMNSIRDDLKAFFSDTKRTTVWHNCMHASSQVLLADGSKMRIDTMVNQKHPGPVLCVNEQTGQLEAKPVVNWLKGDLRPNEEWLRVTFRSKGAISCTVDHEVLTATGRKRADELRPGDRVLTSSKAFAMQKDFLLGTLLGDASISLQKSANAKTPHVRVGHSPHDADYVYWKHAMMKDLTPCKVKPVKNEGGFSKAGDTLLVFTTACDRRLHDIYDLVCVDGVKQLNTNWINNITPQAVAVWYCDDGHLEAGKYPVITSTVPRTLRETLKSKLDSLGLSVRFHDVRAASEGVCRIYLSSGDPAPVWSLLSPWIPESMRRKVPAGMAVGTASWTLISGQPYAEVVDGVMPLFTKNGRDGINRKFRRAREYCLAVEGNPNFFVSNGFAVSNCKFDLHFYAREGIRVDTVIHDTRILWHFFDEDAPGALKTIASGWKDTLGREHRGLVDGAANVKEKELDLWRSKEAKLRREVFRKLVMAEADKLGKDIAHQDKTRNQLKKWIAENVLHEHVYAKTSKDDVDYSYIPVPLMTEYAALDTFLTYKVYEFCVKNIQWTKALSALYRNEMSLLRALFEAEEHGVKIKRKFLEDAGDEFDKQIAELMLKIQMELGDINLNSTNQLADSLLNNGVELTRLTDASESALESDPNAERKFAVDKKVLEKLKGKHSVIQDILKLREASKLKNTYVVGILNKLTADDILHCSFNQNVRTGRMSSQDPNLQNIPSRDKTIRKSFTVPDEDYVYLLADYSQIEVRLTAHYSRDPLLLDAYEKGQDIHTRTFCEMFGHTVEFAQSVLADPTHPKHEEFNLFRTVAKRINFGIIYGVGAPGLSEQIDRPEQYKNLSDKQWVDVCQGFIDQYLAKYVGVKRFVNQGNRMVAKDAQVVNYFGRVRHLPHAHATKILKNDKLYWMEKRAQRQGVNFLIQGCNDPEAPILTVSGYIPMNQLEAHNKPALVQYNGGIAADYEVVDCGDKECVEIVSDVGTQWCSAQHKFFVYNPDTADLEFRSIQDLPVGSLVVGATACVTGSVETSVSEAEAELVGVLIGDGSYGIVRGTNGSRKGVHLRNVAAVACGKDLAWASYVQQLFTQAFPYALPTLQTVRKAKGLNYVVRVENKVVRERLQELGLHRVVRQEKVVPSWVFTAPLRIRQCVLRGLMDTDGGISGHGIGFTNKTRQVAEGVLLLLQSLGIPAKLNSYGGYYRVRVKQEHLHLYSQHVQHQLIHKLEHAQEYATQKFTKSKLPAGLLARVRDCVVANDSVWKTLTRAQRAAVKSLRMNKYAASTYLSMLPASEVTRNLQDLLNLDWVTIHSITPIGVRRTMDLTIHAEDHSYISRGLVQHNTAADLFKISAVRVHKLLKGKKSKLVNFVHDEIQVYLHKNELDLIEPMKHAMENWNFDVPVIAEFSWSKSSWGEKKALPIVL